MRLKVWLVLQCENRGNATHADGTHLSHHNSFVVTGIADRCWINHCSRMDRKVKL